MEQNNTKKANSVDGQTDDDGCEEQRKGSESS
jgi:hypothetical protein